MTDRTSSAYAVMERMLTNGFAAGDPSIVDELCSPDLVEHQFGLGAATPQEALQHVKDAISDVHRAVPDVRFTIEDAVEHNDTIWVRARARGTASGPFFGPPTNNRWTSASSTWPVSSTAGSSSTGACLTASPCSPRPASSIG